MSSSITPSPALPPLPVQSSGLPTILVSNPPYGLSHLPVGTVLQAVVYPPATSADLPLLTITLPSGEEVSFPVKITPIPNATTDITLKILPSEIKDAIALRLQSHLVNFETPVFSTTLNKTLHTQEIKPIFIEKQTPITADAFVLKNVPNIVKETFVLMPLPVIDNAGAKISFQITPTNTIDPVFSTQTSVNFIPKETQKTDFTPPLLTPIQTTNTPVPAPLKMPLTTASIPEILPLDVLKENGTSVAVKPLSPANVTLLQNASLAPITQEIKAQISLVQEPVTLPQTPQVKSDKSVFLETPVVTTKETPSAPIAELSKTSAIPLLRPQTVLSGIVFQPRLESPALIATKEGVFVLETPIHLPHLTPVSLKIMTIQPPIPTAIELDPLPNPSMRTSWTVLAHALETLKQTDLQAFENVKQILPQIGGKLPALMLNFMMAASEGANFKTWLGEANVKALQAMGSKGETILRRLGKEFSTSTKKVTDGNGSWRGIDIPLLSGSIVEPVSLYLQRPPEDGHNGKNTKPDPKTGVRFVLDLSLTQLGNVQMEGLAYRSRRTFDLMIRHQQTLPDTFDTTVRRLFTQTLEALSYAGTIRLSHTQEFLDFRQENSEDVSKKRGVLV